MLDAAARPGARRRRRRCSPSCRPARASPPARGSTRERVARLRAPGRGPDPHLHAVGAARAHAPHRHRPRGLARRRRPAGRPVRARAARGPADRRRRRAARRSRRRSRGEASCGSTEPERATCRRAACWDARDAARLDSSALAAARARSRSCPPPRRRPTCRRPRRSTHDGPSGRYLIDGTWLFRLDPADQGIAQRFERQRVDGGLGAGDGAERVERRATTRRRRCAARVGWYRKDFELPDRRSGARVGGALRVGQLPLAGVAQRQAGRLATPAPTSRSSSA